MVYQDVLSLGAQDAGPSSRIFMVRDMDVDLLLLLMLLLSPAVHHLRFFTRDAARHSELEKVQFKASGEAWC
ncbi:hypothetical protein E2C01_094241 [Portunus trituberculatus]|uniref:Uncharacterized protein n=1 Tax=Portunus trituberculatus TaxID=210409 RepID=A0A5B7K099_PORTR|nr:hypothetical protein [Portunus trituberculatus]